MRRGGSAGRQGVGGGGTATYLYIESLAYDTGPTYEAPNRQVYRKYFNVVIQRPGRPLSEGGHIERI